MLKWCIFILVICCQPILPVKLYPQTVLQTRLTGRIIDASTEKPLHFVNVFLAGTTKGTATDRSGEYSIVHVPLGTYELVASMVGYEIQMIKIHITEPETYEFDLRLKPKPIQAPELRVIGHRPLEWEKNLEKFEKRFLGTSHNASECRILNPEVLSFQYDEKNGLFTASAEKPLLIENRALGYQLDYHLLDFDYYDTGEWKFIGKSKFKTLHPESNKEKREWQKKRLKAYQGSFRHFLIALISHRLEREGFELHGTSGLPYWKNMITYAHEIKSEALLSPGGSPDEITLSFEDYLRVIYTKEETPPEYPGYDVENRYQTSWLKINKGTSVIINTMGYLYDPYDLLQYGYWPWEKLADSLPLDYTPYSRSIHHVFSSISGDSASGSISPRMKTYTLELDSLIDPVTRFNHARVLALEGDAMGATRALYEGLKNLGTDTFADTLYLDTFDIMTTDERRAFKDAADKGNFLLRFWQRQDPTPATLENQRYVEHQRRLEYARKTYSAILEPRGYDDRGMIYLRYGPPDESIEMVQPRGLDPNVCWVYRSSGSEVVFDFIKKAMSFHLMTSLFDLGSESINRLNNIQKAVSGSSPQKSQANKPVPPGLGEFIEPRMAISDRYAYYGAKLGSQDTDILIQDLHKLFREYVDKQYSLPHIETHFRRAEESLLATVTSARFFPHNHPRLEIYYGLPCDLLEFEVVHPGGIQMQLEIAYAIRDSAFSLIDQKNFNRIIRIPADTSLQNLIYIDQINRILAPGKYTISIEIQHPQTGKAFDTTIAMTIPEVSQRDLMISDIELAYSIIPSTHISKNRAFIKENLVITPYPSFSVSKSNPINLYFETYNLMVDAMGTTSYDVEYELRSIKSSFLKKIIPFGKRMALSSSYHQKGNKRSTQEYFALDFNKLKPGEYLLTVRVYDKIGRNSRFSKIPILIEE